MLYSICVNYCIYELIYGLVNYTRSAFTKSLEQSHRIAPNHSNGRMLFPTENRKHFIGSEFCWWKDSSSLARLSFSTNNNNTVHFDIYKLWNLWMISKFSVGFLFSSSHINSLPQDCCFKTWRGHISIRFVPCIHNWTTSADSRAWN